MIAEYHFTAAQAALPYSVMMLVTATWAIVAGKIGDYMQPRFGTMFGGLCFGISLVLCGYTKSPIGILVAIGVFMGLASTSVTVNTSPTAGQMVPREA